MDEPLALNLRGREEGARPELDTLASLRAAEGGSSRSYVLVPCSAGSEGSIMGSPELGFDTPSSVRRMLGAAPSLPPDGLGCPSTTTYALSENQRGELLLTDVAHPLTTGGGKPGQGYSAVLISSAAASPAKTSASPADAPDSKEPAAASSTSSPASSTLFNPDGYSSRTYPGSSPRTAVGTSESCLERWPTSGTACHGGFSTAVSSECRSDADGCSSSEPSLAQILEPPQSVPARYSLSARAAQGILRRADKRGRKLPEHLEAALVSVAGLRTRSA